MVPTTLTERELELLDKVRGMLVDKGVEAPKWGQLSDKQVNKFKSEVKGILINLSNIGTKNLSDMADKLSNAMIGVGILQQHLDDPEIDEIYVRDGEIAIEKGGILYRNAGRASNDYWAHLITRCAEYSNNTIDPNFSAALFNLPDFGDARFTGLLPPLMESPAINIRKFMKRQSFDPKMFEFQPNGHKDTNKSKQIEEKLEGLAENSPMRFLAWAIASQKANVLIAGQFSSGKTTLLNSLGSYIPENAPIAILETFKELNLGPALFSMRATVPSEKMGGETKQATMEWVLNTVYTRANPSAIILGEIVSPGEAMQFIKAANLGRKAYSTIHGATVNAALSRLETLALGNQPELGLMAIKKMIASGLDIVVYMNILHYDKKAVRYISEIAWVKDVDPNGNYVIDQVYKANDGVKEDAIKEAAVLVRSEQ